MLMKQSDTCWIENPNLFYQQFYFRNITISRIAIIIRNSQGRATFTPR